MVNKTKSVLGDGVSRLLGEARNMNNPVAHPGVPEIAISKITPNPDQPRKIFDEEALNELAESIKQYGVITPITVIENGVGSYQIIAGERRWRASKIAGLEKIPAYITAKGDDNNKLILGLVENLQRDDLNAIEIAQSYQVLIENGGLTQEELGEKVNKNHATIANSLRLLKLPPEIQAGLINRDISEGHAKAILSLDDERKQREVYTKIIDEKLSVRDAEDLVRKLKENKKPKIKPSKSEEQKAIQTKISSKLNNAKVSVNVTAKGNGKISIAFKSKEDLEAIIAMLEKIQ